MNIVALFTNRPIATTLLAIGLALAGFGALFLMPVAPLPNIDLPVIVVSANMPGASPEVMSNTVATPRKPNESPMAASANATASRTASRRVRC